MNRSNPNDNLLLGAFLFSGITALALEILWTRLLSLILGGEILAVLGVLAGFFGGMVAGALLLYKKVSTVKNPITAFLILESIIVVYGMVSPYLMIGFTDLIPRWLGPVAGDNSSFLALLITILLSAFMLLPATFGMGANFAFLVEARRRSFHSTRNLSISVGRLYAANTLGATIGIFMAIYFILQEFGFQDSGSIIGIPGIIGIICAWVWSRKVQNLKPFDNKSIDQPTPEKSTYLYLLFITGLLTIGLEINAIHVLKQVLQNTIFTFGNILAIYLLGTSIGAWTYHKFVAKKKYTKFTQFSSLFLMQGITIALMMIVLYNIDAILQVFTVQDGSFTLNILGELCIAALVFFLPTIIMGAIFTSLIGANNDSLVGKGYGINILGSSLAPFLFGLLLIPWIGSYRSIGLIGCLYGLIILYGIKNLDWVLKSKTILPIYVMVFVGLTSFKPHLIKIPDGWEIVEYKEGMMGATVVSELPGQNGPFGLPLKILQINNRFKMGGGAGFLEKRMGSLPLLLHPNAKKALYLGLGTGTTLGMASHAQIDAIDAVEIVPEVKSVLPLFQEYHQNIFSVPGVNYHTADARRFIRASKDEYDLIVGDLFHPARDGAGLLFTLNHFAYLADHLAEDGLVVQWLPLYQFDLDNLKTVIRSFMQVFSKTHAFIGGYNADLPALALVASRKDLRIDYQSLDTNLSPGRPFQAVYENPFDIMASYLMGPTALKSFTGSGPLNLDQHPVVLFEAPKSIYRKEVTKARENMAALLEYRKEFPDSFWYNADLAAISQGAATWIASGYFMKGNLEKSGNDLPSAGLENYIKAYNTSPDFSPARGQLFQVAMQEPALSNRILNILNNRDRQRLLSIISN